MAATGPQAYAAVQSAIVYWPCQIMLLGVTFAFFLHFCGGIRHLVWDTRLCGGSRSLTIWLVASIVAHTGSDYATFVTWLRTPIVMILIVLLVIALSHHTALGLQVVIEDYVHSGAKFGAVIAVMGIGYH